jgi:thiamine-phosphate pyrophosphorylase
VKLYAITDRTLQASGDLVMQASSLIRAGVDILQIREKNLCDAALSGVLKVLAPEARRFGCTLLVNGRADLALLSGAGGVHLPSQGISTADARRLLPRPLMVVRSCHSMDEVLLAAREGADAVTVGPVYETPSKKAYGSPMGLEAFGAICTVSSIPVFGLGGIDEERLEPVRAAGAAGIAAIRLFCATKNPYETVQAIRDRL